ncbi:unnamed protein product [Chrysoparadoxa australica]
MSSRRLGGSKSPLGGEGSDESPAMQDLEDELSREINPVFFEAEESFKPFLQVIEILSLTVGEEDGEGAAGGVELGSAAANLASNPMYNSIQQQLAVCSEVVEKITVEHHSSLNAAVQAMGGVARHYNQTRQNVLNLREEVMECKGLLQTGSQPTDLKDLWDRKLQYAQGLRILDMLDMIKDAPAKFDRLVRQKCFVAAVHLLNSSLQAIFSPDLVDVPAVADVRDDLLHRKGIILDTIVKELACVLFLRSATDYGPGGGRGSKTDPARGRGRRWQGAPSRGDNSDAEGGALGAVVGAAAAAAREAEGEAHVELFAGLKVDTTPLGLEEERSMDDPSQDFGAYLRLLVEAVRQLRSLDDVENLLLESLPEELENLSAAHMRTCAAAAAGAAESTGGAGSGVSKHRQALVQYLRTAFEAFVRIVQNHIHLVRLMHCAKLRDLREADPKGKVLEADAPYCADLPEMAWRCIQEHLRSVLSRHVATLTNSAGQSQSGLAREISRPLTGMATGNGRTASRRGSSPVKPPRSQLASLGYSSHASSPPDQMLLMSNELLAEPSPYLLVSLFQPTQRFITAVEAMLAALRKEMSEGAQKRGGRRGRQLERQATGGSQSIMTSFLNEAVNESLLPFIMKDSNEVFRSIADDYEALLPPQDASALGRPKGELSPARLGGTLTQVAVPRPGKGAEMLYNQAKPIYKAMLHIPRYAEQVSTALEITLDNFYGIAQDKLAELAGGSHAYKRLERHGDRLRDLLSRDASYSSYKCRQHGGQLPFERAAGPHSANISSKANLALLLDPSPRRRTLNTSPTLSPPEPTAEEMAADHFESEYALFFDMWNFGIPSYPVTKKGLLSMRVIKAVASLCFSCDWLAHRILRMCAGIEPAQARESERKNGKGRGSPSPMTSPASSRSPVPASRGFSRAKEAAVATPSARLRAVAKKLSGLADDCLLCLRLDTYCAVAFYTQQLVALDLGDSRETGKGALGMGSVEDMCVVDLNRHLQELHEGLSPIEPKEGVGLVAPRELFAATVLPLPRLLPRLLVHFLRYYPERSISTRGVGRLTKVASTLLQTTLDVTSTGAFEDQEHERGLIDSIGKRFSRSLGLWAHRYTALLSMTSEQLESFIRENRAEFTKAEYEVQWKLAGPNRSGQDNFESWWASAKWGKSED